MAKHNSHIRQKDLYFIFGWMEAADDDDLPDGAWWAVLENAAQAALDHLHLRGDAFELVDAYIKRNRL